MADNDYDDDNSDNDDWTLYFQFSIYSIIPKLDITITG